jgi:hypothetical protein
MTDRSRNEPAKASACALYPDAERDPLGYAPPDTGRQTWLGSIVEAKANIAVGFAINWCANMLVLPLFGFAVTAGEAFGIGLVFTVISLVRQLVLRRWFNGMRFGNRSTP